MDHNVPVIDQLRDQIQCLARLKMLIVILGVFVLSLLLFRVRKDGDMQYIKDSLSNFYKDFNPILEDFQSVRAFAERSKEAEKPLVELETLQKASRDAEVKIDILKNYESDKTGRVDLALYDSGARIAGISQNTKTFYNCNFLWKLIGCPNKVQGPENVIKTCMHYGSCFRFKGKTASIFIRLIKPAIVDSVTIEHITKKMSLDNEVTSAPRIFTISGLNYKEDMLFPFGSFQFNANKTSIQTYNFHQRASEPHRYVKVEFLDNNGHPSETCVYRVRVHGVVEGVK